MGRAIYTPHLGKQTEFISCQADNILFGGARGPGKSFGLAFKAAFSVKRGHWIYKGKKITQDQYLQFYAAGKKCKYVAEKIAIDYPEYVAILIRRTCPQLERNLKPETEKLYKLYGAKWQEKQRRYLFPSGAMIYLVHCKDRRALDDYIGGNYNFIGFDEVNQFPQEWVDAITTSNRTVNPELKPQTCLTSNPGNIGHCLAFGEVLTKDGWLDIRDVEVGEQVATLDENENIIYANVDQVHKDYYSGEMLNFNAKTANITCTPNHQIARRTETKTEKGRTYHDISLIQAKDLSKVTKIIRGGEWRGGRDDDFIVAEYKLRRKKHNQPKSLSFNNYASLMGWYLSEGCTVDRDRAFGIAQSKKNNRVLIENLLKSCGFKYSKDDVGFTVYAPDWWNYFRQFGKCRDKYVPSEIKDATKEGLQIFFDSIMLGDGCGNHYYTTSRRLADDMQEIGLKLGYSPYLSYRQRPNREGLSYDISFRKGRDGWLERDTCKKEKYDGMVYCLGIDGLHRFFVRQNGTIWLSGNSWLKRTYVDRCPPTPGETIYNKELDIKYTLQISGKVFFDENGVSWQYIPSLVFENPSLMKNDPGYIKKLKNLKPTLQKMWLFGEWGAFIGMFFDKWDENTHVIDMADKNQWFRYNKEFSKHTHTLYRFYDYGTKAPFVCLFAAVDENDNIIIFDEIVETGLASSAQAKLVNEYTLKKYKLTPDDFSGEYADPQYWAKHSEKDNLPYAPEQHYADEGIYLQQGVRDRQVGAKIIYDAFEPVKDSVPRIRFTSNCVNCIEHIPALASKENDPEDVDSLGEDHEFDALRFGGTIILPGLTVAPDREKGWRTRMAKKFVNMDGRGSTSEATWKSA